MKYMLLFVAGVVLLVTFTKRDVGSMQARNDQTAILAFGDSLTHGFGAKAHESYPAILTQLTGRTVHNEGINGDTSSEALRRLPQVLTRYPDVKLMILCIGGNDLLRRQSEDQLKTNIITMIRMAKAKGLDVLLVSVPDLSLLGLSPPGLYDDAADETDTPLAEGILAKILNQRSLKSDQIHPNAKGYRQMAEGIYKVMKEKGWVE